MNSGRASTTSLGLLTSIFPVKTPVDREKLRAYFNAGVLILRPEMGVLRRWPSCFATLYTDSVFVTWCKQDQLKAIFLHQAALAGAILFDSPQRRHDRTAGDLQLCHLFAG